MASDDAPDAVTDSLKQGPFALDYEEPPRPGFSWVAMAGLACSVANFFLLYPYGCVLGLILGFQARRIIRRSNGTQWGTWVAYLAIYLGAAGVVIDALTIVVHNLHPNW